MAAVYTALSGALGAVMMLADRDEAVRAMEIATADIARLLDEHANRSLDAAEQVVLRLADRATALGLDAAAGDRHAALGMLDGVSHLANLHLLDSAGRVVMDARGFRAAGASLAGADWVKALRDGGDPGTVIGAVAHDDARHLFSFTVARRVVDRSGRFIGIAAAVIDAEYFKRFYGGLGYGPAAALGVYRLDGAVLVRQPMKVEDVGRSMAPNPIFTIHLPKAPAGTYRGRSAYDGVDRVVSYRSLPERKLVVWVSLGADEAMAGWRVRTLRTGFLLLAGLGVMGLLTWLLLRELARERKAAASLVALNRDLERSNADLEQFAYIASHDLKEPLRNIGSYVQLLQRRYAGRLDPDADAFIGYTVDGVRRMQTIIHELLAYSRIGTGQLTLVPVQAGALISSALSSLKTIIAEAQAAIEVKGPLPMVEADAALLGSLFQNLIGNGLKYRRDEVRPEVSIGCHDRGADWAFYVQDNGIGIDREYHQQIFHLFKRLHPRDRYQGTGIGLTICQRVVERHGGHIWVESAPGKGSTFWFTLPKRAVG